MLLTLEALNAFVAVRAEIDMINGSTGTRVYDRNDTADYEELHRLISPE